MWLPVALNDLYAQLPPSVKITISVLAHHRLVKSDVIQHDSSERIKIIDDLQEKLNYPFANININHNHNYTYRSIDETGIRKAELEADLQKRKLNKEDREDKLRHMGIVFWTAVLLLICLGGPAALLLFPSDYEKQHKRQVAEFEQLVQEIEVDIENKDYDSARIKANKIHYTANWSDDAKERWDAVREDTLALIDELQYGIKTEKKEKEKGFFDSVFGNE